MIRWNKFNISLIVGVSLVFAALGASSILYFQPVPEGASEFTAFHFIFISFFALIFATIGVFQCYHAYKIKRNQHYLENNGHKVEAHVTSITKSTGYSHNGNRPFVINAQYNDSSTNTPYVYQSDLLWFDPTDYVDETIPVLINPQNPSEYWVDISFLPTPKF